MLRRPCVNSIIRNSYFTSVGTAIMSKHRIILLPLLAAAWAVPVKAHHSSAPHFDSGKEVVIENAIITELKLVNPHAYIYFEGVGTEGKNTGWRCELRAATILRRMGWTDESFTPGQVVTIKGSAARREDNVCALTSVTLADGTEVNRSTNLSGVDTQPDEVLGMAEASGDRPAQLENGQPNISGYWLTLSFGRARGGAMGAGMGPPAMGAGMGGDPYRGYDPTAANIAAAESYDVRFDDPALKCHPINIIQGWNHDNNVNEITQSDNQIELQYGFMDFARTIHLDIEHPSDISPSTGGHSVGKWEDDVLVVDTIGFEPGVLSHLVGVLHSDQLHIVERFRFDADNRELVRDYVIEDSLYLNSPYTGQDKQGISAEPYTPFNCTELSGKNNLRPDDI